MEQRLIVRVFLVLVLSRGSKVVIKVDFLLLRKIFSIFEPKKIVILCIRNCWNTFSRLGILGI